MSREPRWHLGLGRENGLIFWAMLLLEASFAAYFLLLPLYIAALGASPAQVGFTLGIWGLLRLVFLAPAFKLSPHRRRGGAARRESARA